MAVLLAGLPVSVPGDDGEPAVRLLPRRGDDRLARRSRPATPTSSLAGGVESMTRAPWVLPKPSRGFPGRRTSPRSRPRWAGGWSTSGCRRSGRSRSARPTSSSPTSSAISRERQDEFAARSHRLAARGLGRRASTTTWWCRCPGVDLARDEGIRPGSHRRDARRAEAVVPPRRHHHRRQRLPAQRRRLRGAARLARRPPTRSGVDPLARIAGRGRYALEPQLFGYRPGRGGRPGARAGPGIGWADVGAVELNEAFAVQSLACVDAWGIDPEIVNTRGGAIAIGHPLGRLRRPDPRHPGRTGCASPATAGASPRSASASARRLAVVLENVGRRRGVSDRRARTDADEAVADIADGATVLIGGFGMAGMPVRADRRADPAGRHRPHRGQQQRRQRRHRPGRAARRGPGAQDRSAPSRGSHDSWVFDGLYRAGRIELEVVPQGNLAERMRAAGAGIGAFFCPTGVGTPLAEGKETREHRRPRPTCWSTRSSGDVALIGRTSPTGWATSSTARPPATSGR